MDRKAKLKHARHSIEKIRARKRQEDIALRKERRSKVLNAKRIRHGDADDKDDEIAKTDVQAACMQLQKKGDHRLECLQTLRKAFAQSSASIDIFFNVENSLACLVGILTGSDVEQQLEAAWCLTNLATGTQEQALQVAKAAAPYLLTYLESSNVRLQDQCAWAVGNLAGDSKECRDILYEQGSVPPLVTLLEHHDDHVAQSAAFALSNLARECEASAEEMIKKGVTKILSAKLKTAYSNQNLLAELAWVLTYLSSKSCNQGSELVAKGILKDVVDILVRLGKETEQEPLVLTPILRCLGNMLSGPDEYSLQACSNPELIPTLSNLLLSEHRHIAKETLWVLSNMSGEPSIAQTIISSPIITHTFEFLGAAYDMKQEAIYLLCNLASHGPEACAELVKYGMVARVTPLLQLNDVDVLQMALYLIEMALRTCPESKQVFEDNHGLTYIERLEYHSNEILRGQANDLLENHFYRETEAAAAAAAAPMDEVK